MSQPLNNRSEMSVANLHNTPVETLSKTAPFDSMDKPDWVASQGVSKSILVMLALVYTIVASFVLYLSFRGAAFMYGVPIGIVVGVFTFAAIFMVWYVAMYHKTIPPVWKIAILVFELIIMGFDVYVSAAGWNLSKISTFAEKVADEREDQYINFHAGAEAVYGYVGQLKTEAERIALQEKKENGGEGPIFRISDATAKKLSKDSLQLPLLEPVSPVFNNSLTLKDLNTKLVNYHDLFRAQEAELKAELSVTRAMLIDQIGLVGDQLKKPGLNEYQKESVSYLIPAIVTSIEEADKVLAIEIPAPEITSRDIQSVSQEGVKMRLLSAAGLLFFLGLISILTWPRSKKRGTANDPYRWFEWKFIETTTARFNISFGYTEEEALRTAFGTLDDELLSLLSNPSVRTRIDSSGLTYRDLRELYSQLGRSAFQRLFSTNSGWSAQQINQLLDDPTYGSMVRPILQKLTYQQFAEIRLFRPNGGVADVVAKTDDVANYYAQIVVATKHRMHNASQREAFIDRFMTVDSQDPEFYEKLLLCINRFDARQLNVLPVSFVNAGIQMHMSEIVSLFDNTDGTFELATSLWTLPDSVIVADMIERSAFATIAGLIEQGNRINPRLWTDIRNHWQSAVKAVGRNTRVPINTSAASTVAKATEEETIRTGLVSVFTT